MLDHSEFIARHHKPPEQEAKDRRARSSQAAFMAFLLLAIYIVFCVTIAFLMDVDSGTLVAAEITFIIATMLGFVFQRIFGLYRQQGQDLALLRAVLEGSRGARLVSDPLDKTIFCNDKFEALCEGIGPPSFDTLTHIFAESDEARAGFRLLAEEARRGIAGTVELQVHKEGRERFYSVAALPLSEKTGFIHWRIDDVSARRGAEHVLREEREKLIDFTDNAPVGFFSVDGSGRFVFVNATLARWLGEDIAFLLERGRLHMYLDSPPQGGRPYDILPGGGARQIGEVRIKGPGGATFPAAVSQTVVQDPDGAVRTRGVVHDLTDERAMRQALEASETRFQKFFEEAPLGIALIDPGGLLKDCNAAFAAMLGLPAHDIEGRPFESFLSENDRAEVLSAMLRIEQGRQIAPMDIVLAGKASPVAVQLHARKFTGSDNIVLHFIDLTNQRALEAQFVQSQKMQAIGQLAGGVAHDFNNLLTAMTGFCDLLLLRHKPGDPSFADIMQIKQNANRAANLVRQLLAFSRQQTLRPRVQDVTDILTEISHLLRRLIGANIELDLIHGQNIGLVKVDEGQMEQVLINLAVNARDAMESGGRLSIKTSAFENTAPVRRGADEMPPGQWVLIEVSDTGHGIPPDILPRIFEPFFTTKDVGKGTGLGLATVYGIIRQTGGYLHVDSAPGKGALFSIYLPCVSGDEVRQAEKGSAPEEGQGRDLTGTARILLVEDEDAVRTFATRALTNKGYQVLSAPGGDEALAMMPDIESGGGIDLLVSDVVMPGTDGPTLARKMREKRPDLKIIFISGYTEDRLKDEIGGNVWFLPKPFSLGQLAAKVKDVLEG